MASSVWVVDVHLSSRGFLLLRARGLLILILGSKSDQSFPKLIRFLWLWLEIIYIVAEGSVCQLSGLEMFINTPKPQRVN